MNKSSARFVEAVMKHYRTIGGPPPHAGASRYRGLTPSSWE
jgi:hypothetical protein